MLEILHQAVLCCQLRLHRDEVRVRIADVRHEEQARVEPAERVVALGEL